MWQTVQQDTNMTFSAFSRHLPRMLNPNNPSTNQSIFYQAMAEREDESVQPLCISERFAVNWIRNIMASKRFKKNHLALDKDKKLVAWESTWHREEDGPFFKVYLQGVDDLHAVKGALDVLVELCKQMDRAAEGSLIRITRFDREAISKKCNITEGHFKNIITALVKRNVLKRIANQIYAMNPTIIAKGYPEEVLKLRKEWGYSNDDFETVKPFVFRDDQTNLVNEIVLAMADKITANNENLSAEMQQKFQKILTDALVEAGYDMQKKPDFTVVK
ncbi:MAG: replication/maintenance protein RepL [Succinivibrionaceae bacterium]|nr:replication/maintenance protein RepL [Succinivibrionaceae bacterium]